MQSLARFLSVLLSALALIAAPQAVQAQEFVAEGPVVIRETVTVTVIIEEWTEVPASRFVAGADLTPAAIASYGPFRVIDGTRAALVGTTDTASPRDFRAMLAAHPGIEVLELVEAPGTLDDRANLEVGRLIRAAGLETRVPANGSVRSGAVELVLAGTQWDIDPAAEFAVHAWEDDLGRSAKDYPMASPEHRKYLAYYTEMGMDAEAAKRFYAMTNEAPFESARWLDGAEMRDWLGLPVAKPAVADTPVSEMPTIAQAEVAAPRLAYASL